MKMWHVRRSWQGDKAGLCKARWARWDLAQEQQEALNKGDKTLSSENIKTAGEWRKHWRQTTVGLGGLIQTRLLGFRPELMVTRTRAVAGEMVRGGRILGRPWR